MEYWVEKAAFRKWRRKLWGDVPAGRVLEVGVGTGKNFPFYPEGTRVTAIDISERMLRRARRKVDTSGAKIELHQMDAQDLDFADESFDAAVATFVFCSVPDPMAGLRELGRVTRSDGAIRLIEHVRIDQPFIGRIMDLFNPVVVRLSGANINRRTVENVRRAGLAVSSVESLSDGLVKLIHAKPGKLQRSKEHSAP
jgi:ubiquinone/menaquinone biosynthesis C-methylase UbiE